MEVLSDRARRGVNLFHSGDVTYFDVPDSLAIAPVEPRKLE
jgi:hypothetical protein